ncbi:hypothetical protein RIF29_20226 [Crotalaria pallida]|uniref:Uncharacterized protein n=1 Tax=Crotalaria pallida TaxID=3830 RepID=A0AAN9I798_CROPI
MDVSGQVKLSSYYVTHLSSSTSILKLQQFKYNPSTSLTLSLSLSLSLSHFPPLLRCNGPPLMYLIPLLLSIISLSFHNTLTFYV